MSQRPSADEDVVAAALASFAGLTPVRKEALAPPPDPQRAVLKRVGLSVLQNSDYWQQSREEVADAERELQELKRESRLRAARCDAQLDALARQCRAEEERRLISEKVSKELALFRKEMEAKEAAENERLRHLYRGIMGGDAEPAFKDPGYQAASFPPVIASVGDLMQEDCFWERPRQVEVDPQPYTMEFPIYESKVEYKRKKKGGSDPEYNEAQRLLRLNLGRLQRLERCGL